jgi:rod shape-determining protein MreD
VSRHDGGRQADILRANSLSADNAEPSLARKALAGVVLVAALFAAVIVQLTVVNRLPLPGGAAPDLVLLLVTAIAVFTSPLAGALAGFAGGLALDVAPPGMHYAGAYALVFCLAGWGAARVDRAIRQVRGEGDQVTAFAVMAGAAAAGEAGKVALGLMLSDPDVTGAVASRVLPTAILYDLLVAPFVFWLVARLTRGADAERAPAPEFTVEQRLALVFRSASAGAAPRLRLAGSGANYQQPQPARQVPRLRLSGSHGRPGGAAVAAIPGGAVPLPARRSGARRAPKLSFGGDLAASTRQARTGQASTGQVQTGRRAPGKGWLRGAPGVALAGSPALRAQAAAAGRRAPRGPGRGWITAAGPAGRGAADARHAPRGPSQGWITPGSLVRPPNAHVSRGPAKGWITPGSLAGPAGKRAPRAPARGWITAGSLAEPSARRASGLGKGWITAGSLAGPSARRVSGLGKGWITAGSLAGPSARRASGLGKGWITAGSLARPGVARTGRGPGPGFLRATGPGGPGRGLARPGGARSAETALAARSAPSGLSALSGSGTPMSAGSAPRRGPRRGWLAGTGRRPAAVLGSRPYGRTPAIRATAFRGTAFRGTAFRGRAFRGARAYHGDWYTAAPSGERRPRGRHPWRQRGQRLLRLVGVGR